MKKNNNIIFLKNYRKKNQKLTSKKGTKVASDDKISFFDEDVDMPATNDYPNTNKADTLDLSHFRSKKLETTNKQILTSQDDVKNLNNVLCFPDKKGEDLIQANQTNQQQNSHNSVIELENYRQKKGMRPHRPKVVSTASDFSSLKQAVGFASLAFMAVLSFSIFQNGNTSSPVNNRSLASPDKVNPILISNQDETNLQTDTNYSTRNKIFIKGSNPTKNSTRRSPNSLTTSRNSNISSHQYIQKLKYLKNKELILGSKPTSSIYKGF